MWIHSICAIISSVERFKKVFLLYVVVFDLVVSKLNLYFLFYICLFGFIFCHVQYFTFIPFAFRDFVGIIIPWSRFLKAFSGICDFCCGLLKLMIVNVTSLSSIVIFSHEIYYILMYVIFGSVIICI